MPHQGCLTLGMGVGDRGGKSSCRASSPDKSTVPLNMRQMTFTLALTCVTDLDEKTFKQLGGIEFRVSSIKDDGSVDLFISGPSGAVTHMVGLVTAALRDLRGL
jgi:hypothetical protein